MIIIGEHSVEETLISKGIAIDVGCRGFAFTVGMRDLGCKVLSFDLEQMEAPPGIQFVKAAIMDKPGHVLYTPTKDQQAKFISEQGTIPVDGIGINELLNDCEYPVDILKLDCEGSEYFILQVMNPIPKQVSVEFHEHAHKDLHQQYFDACINKLLENYVAVKHDRYPAHGAGMNYWDSLFIRKDLL